jgi:putative acetyltransferase
MGSIQPQAPVNCLSASLVKKRCVTMCLRHLVIWRGKPFPIYEKEEWNVVMDTTNLIIRSERVMDYPEISALHLRAFNNRPGHALVVPLHRHRRGFDPELSLVAEIEGRVVGHVLFSPHQMHLLDQTIPTVNLAPLAVDPASQGQGIGGRLIREGHRIAAVKGYQVSVLLGHPTYYPRFGYQMHAFGPAQLLVPSDALHEDLLKVRRPSQEDGPQLSDLWDHEEGMVDMVFEPGRELLDWLSPHPAVRATVYLRNSEIVGYTRIHAAESTQPRVFLARDHEAARAMVVTLFNTLKPDPSGTVYTLPLHPSSASAQAFGSARATCHAFSAGMAYSLGKSPLDDYFAHVREGQRPPGRVLWPVAFDLT